MELPPLLFLSFCFLTLSGRTFAAESVTSVIVKEDDDAILPCSLSTNEKTESKVFDWKKEGTVQVFTYNNGDHHNNVLTDQNEQFRGRVSHFPEELKHGNASIKINKTMRDDKGNYTCLLSGIKKFHVELVVEPILKVRNIPGAAPKPYVTILEKKGELECEVPGAYPKPTVEWWDSDNKTLPSKTLQDRKEQDRFHIIIQTTAPKSGCYRCVTTQMNIWHQISSKICVHEDVRSGIGMIKASVFSVIFGITVFVAV